VAVLDGDLAESLDASSWVRPDQDLDIRYVAAAQRVEDKHGQGLESTFAFEGCIAEALDKVRLIAAGSSWVRPTVLVGNA
jgi:hypothetical protein